MTLEISGQEPYDATNLVPHNACLSSWSPPAGADDGVAGSCAQLPLAKMEVLLTTLFPDLGESASSSLHHWQD
jgi:hypothetical protein